MTIDSTPETIASDLNLINKSDEENITLNLSEGTYQGPLSLLRGNVSINGPLENEAKFTAGLSALTMMPDGLKRGTFNTQTFFIDGDNVSVKNVTFENTAGPGETAGQALSMYADGRHISFENCMFLGFQDTLFLAPLPEKEKEPRGFKGPKEFSERRSGSYCFKNCYIEGTVDFIFGGGFAVFNSCRIVSKKRPDHLESYVTAPSTLKNSKYGFVFDSCRFEGDADNESVYLSRPWREDAYVCVMNSYLGEHIAPTHWHDWGKANAHETVRFYEYGNFGPGAADKEKLSSFAKFIAKEESLEIEKEIEDFKNEFLK